jgi:hypothetical protein
LTSFEKLGTEYDEEPCHNFPKSWTWDQFLFEKHEMVLGENNNNNNDNTRIIH